MIGISEPVTGGPVTDDLGLGIDAWYVDDDGTDSRFGWGHYYQYIPWAQYEEVQTDGWKLTARVRVSEAPDDPNGASVFVGYVGDGALYALSLGTDASGNQTLNAWEDGTGSRTYNTGSDGYHLYEVFYDPNVGSADIFVDGTEAIRDWAGKTYYGDWVVSWGSLGPASTGRGHYSLVEFEVPVPEPTAIATLTLGGLLFLRRRRR
ncbi:MAG: PEP-CTERM sorting domain-containing protein [Phycisphaerae bacterium]|nr:PEP-CTERM sorting domain-containing protein [Phycisphaerae bacterium]